jgi:predicted dehydrogenase
MCLLAKQQGPAAGPRRRHEFSESTDMSSSKLRVAIVGCGKIADAHVGEVRATGKAEVVAVCDRELLMAKQLSDRFGIQGVFNDMATMLRETRPDVVHIATPPDSHLPLARLAFAQGCHVFLEKPFALNAQDTQKVYDEAAQAGRQVAVNYLYNHESPYVELMQRIGSGSLGELVHIDASYGYDLAGDYGLAVLSDPTHWVHRLPGKLFHNVLDHVLCKVAPLFGPEEIQATCVAFRRRAAVGNPVVDALPDELRFVLRCGILTMNGYISAHARPVTHTMRVLGTRDSVALDFVGRTCVPVARQRYPSSIGRLIPALDQAREFGSAFRRNVGAFRRYEYSFFQGMRSLLNTYYGFLQGSNPAPQQPEVIVRTAYAIDQIIEGVNRSTAEADRSPQS